jgi:hypothetical protein
LPETTKVLFFLVVSVVTILAVAFAPYSWISWYWWRRLLPERITNTRWWRGAWRGVTIVLLLVMAYGVIFLGWKR